MADTKTIITVVDASKTQKVSISGPNTNLLVSTRDGGTVTVKRIDEVAATVGSSTVVVSDQVGSTSVSTVDSSTGIALSENNQNVNVQDSQASVISFAEQGPAGASLAFNQVFHVELNSSLLPLELTPGVITVALPSGKTFIRSSLVIGSVDGRLQPEGRGWQRNSSLLSVDLYLPTDPTERMQYLNANIQFDIYWVQPDFNV